jgi:hypothetical protein
VDLQAQSDARGVLRTVGMASQIKCEVELLGSRAKPDSIVLRYFGSSDELLPLRPAAASDGENIAGRYVCRMIGTEGRIAACGDAMALELVGERGSADFTLACIADGVWRAQSTRRLSRPVGAILSFEPDRAAFRLSTYGIRALTFQRIA